MMLRWHTVLTVLVITSATYVMASSLTAPRDAFAKPDESLGTSSKPSHPFVGAFYLGAEACADCHDEKVDAYKQTSHYQAMLIPGSDTMPRHFTPADHNEMRTRSDTLWYEMTKDDTDYFQTSIEEQTHGVERHTERIALIMGSGKIAHSYHFWQDRALFQLPLVFFTPLDVWANAPGFLDTWPRWDREIEPRCLECHSTYFEEVPGSQNAYFRDTMVMRITCERCHGPGSKHVDFHDEEPDAEARYIVDPRELERQRNLEICSQCHGSIGTPVQASFRFVPGQPLGDYLKYSDDDDTTALVHTVNQLQRLEQSECFKHSDMTCIDCHDPHVHERDELVTFSARCMECHEIEHCGASQRLGDSIAENCIDCHMPLRDDASTPFYMAAGDALPLIQLRDHLVAVHPEDSAEMEARWNDPQRDPDTTTRARLHAQKMIVDIELAAAEDVIRQLNYKEAITRLRRGLGVDPDRDDVRLRLAWLLATVPTASLRDGPQARELAEAVSDSIDANDWQRMDVLAAAMAECGEFDRAVEIASRAMDACPEEEKDDLESPTDSNSLSGSTVWKPNPLSAHHKKTRLKRNQPQGQLRPNTFFCCSVNRVIPARACFSSAASSASSKVASSPVP